MSLLRIPEYPTRQQFESTDDYTKRLRDRIQEEAADRVQDFDILQLGNVPWVDVRTYGATGDGSTDDTTAIQAAIDDGYDNTKEVLIPSDTYAVTGLKVYPNSRLRFVGGGELLMTAASGFVISTKDSPTAANEYPTTYVRGIIIKYPKIDMDKKGDCGIWLECINTCKVVSPEIYDVPASTFSYDDGAAGGSQTYEKCGIAIKGTDHATEIGCLYNRIEHPFISGTATGDRGEVGILLTTSGGETTPKSNYNTILQPRIRWFAKGIFIEVGNDNYIDMPELSNNTVGIDDDANRTLIIKPYLETLTEGIDAVGATNQLIIGNGNIGTISGDKHKNTGGSANTNRWIHNEYQSAASVYLSGDQTVTHNSTEVIEFDTELYDLDTSFATGTYKYTTKDAGLYHVVVNMLTKETDDCTLSLLIKIDGTTKARTKFSDTNSVTHTLSVSQTLSLAAGKEITAALYAANNTDSGNMVIDSNPADTYMTIERVIC